MAITYATWNPSDKHANVTLTGWNLIATSLQTTWRNARATIWVSSWKWYWEYQITGWASETMSAIGTSSATLWGSWSTYPGSDTFSYWYYGNWGNKYNNSSWSAYGSWYTTGDIIGIALDMNSWTLIFYKNNVSQWTAYTWLSGTFFPIVGLDANGQQVTANFWATTMTYTAPAGYNQWLYTWTANNSSPFLAFM